MSGLTTRDALAAGLRKYRMAPYDDGKGGHLWRHTPAAHVVSALIDSGAVIDVDALADDEALVQAFRDGWEAADARGESGSRVKAGLHALATALAERAK